MCRQRSCAKNGCLPRLLRREPYGRIDRTTVDLDLEMEVGAGRQARDADRAYHLSSRDRIAVGHNRRRKMAVKLAHVAIRRDHDIQSRALSVVSDVCGA